MEYIRDSKNNIIATQTKFGDRTITRDFTTNKVVATYNENTNRTWDTKSNTQSKGDQSKRFIK